jgi:fatty acid desaturase
MSWPYSKDKRNMVMENLEKISEEFSFDKEKEIARSFSKRFQWEMVLIGVGQATVWLSLWPLVINGHISLLLGSVIATICACFAYLPSHEAQHGNYSRGNPKRRWIDSFVSHYTLITLMFPHDVMRVVFFPLETLLLWWLPSKFGVIYLSVFFSWYPHYQTETGRYKDTRFWSHWMPRYLNHSMQLHFIHHLHPGIGHYDEPKAIEALKPFLIARGVPGAEDIPDKVKHNPLIEA